jgi:hypothetical protein
MTVPLPYYVKIKDRYCVAYFGNAQEYLFQLVLLRGNVERELPGIQVYIACKDELFDLIREHDRTLTWSQMRESVKSFAYIRELRCDTIVHPVLELMEESAIPLAIPIQKRAEANNLCVISPESNFPTANLSPEQISKASAVARANGYQVALGRSWEEAGWVIGVENLELFRAAAAGVRTSLVPTGLGTALYQGMFPDGKVLKI